MGRKIGNLGVLNLLNATEKSVADIESIENVGMILYRKETAHLLTRIPISNIGKSLEVPEGYQLIYGLFHLNEALLASLEEPARLMVNGTVIVDRSVTAEQLKAGKLSLIAGGTVYVPGPLFGPVSAILGSGKIEMYEGEPPRFETGTFELSNAFLHTLPSPLQLVVTGTFILPENLDLKLADEKIGSLKITGSAVLREGQESFFYRKTDSLAACKIEIIPQGYEVAERLLRLNARSIRRFRNRKLYTRHPVILESDIGREAFASAFDRLESSSFILCKEDLEDLVYERCPSLETEVLVYEHGYVYIEGEETWGEEQFRALEAPVSFVVDGKLTLEADVREETLKEKLADLALYGHVAVPDNRLKGLLHSFIRTQTGEVRVEGANAEDSFLHNIGMLTL